MAAKSKSRWGAFRLRSAMSAKSAVVIMDRATPSSGPRSSTSINLDTKRSLSRPRDHTGEHIVGYYELPTRQSNQRLSCDGNILALGPPAAHLTQLNRRNLPFTKLDGHRPPLAAISSVSSNARAHSLGPFRG